MRRIKLLVLLGCMVLMCSCTGQPAITLNITLPKMDNVQNINTNYYKLWLEEQTGYNIVFNEVSGAFEQEYITDTLADENINTDIIFFGGSNNDSTLINNDDILSMTEYFYPLDEYIVSGTNVHSILSAHSDDEWREFLSDEHGNLYFFPSANPSRSAKNGQSIWINTSWLNNLGLNIPTTVQELEYVLAEFHNKDANNNGRLDEIPIAGSIENIDTMSYNAIINAFVYYDVASYGFYIKNNDLHFSPMENEFREALIYLNSLYEKELLHPLQFLLDNKGLTSLATDPADILGAFSASHLSDVFSESDSNRFSHFTQLAPLKGSVQYSVPQTVVPAIAAAISANTDHPKQAFELLDLMCSEEAFLIAYYGEEGVDWEYARPTDVDIFGEVAQIATINHLSGFMQNKNFDDAGIMYHYPHYVDGVRYTDFDIGYFNARALLANEAFFVESGIGLSLLKLMQNSPAVEERFNDLNNYIQENIKSFIIGEKDISDDELWQEYMDGYNIYEDLFNIVNSEVLG